MSIDPINIGGAANDGNGQSLRSGGQVINSNFAQLDTRTAAAQTKAEQGVADAATAQAKADAAIPGSAAGSSVAQLVNGVVPASQLPSFVDDVLEFATLAGFPATGEAGKIYIAINDGDSPSNPTRQYRWSGTAYVLIPSSPGSTDQVPEGSTNLYHTAARVRAAQLTGLSISLSDAVVATDSVLTGIGKLQKQVSDAVIAIGSKLDKSGGALSGALNQAPVVTLASSVTPAIGAAAANTITITGTTGITGFDIIASGAVRTLVFAGIVTLTHNATSLILPKGANITTAAGDVLQFTSLGGGNWRCTGKLVAADGANAAWGAISGTLSAQTDLQGVLTALDARTTALETGYQIEIEVLWSGSTGSAGPLTLSRNLRVGDMLFLQHSDAAGELTYLVPLKSVASGRSVRFLGGTGIATTGSIGATPNILNIATLTSGYGISSINSYRVVKKT